MDDSYLLISFFRIYTMLSNLEMVMDIYMTPDQRDDLLRYLTQGSHEMHLYTISYIKENFLAIKSKSASLENVFQGLGFFTRTEEGTDLLNGILVQYEEQINSSLRSVIFNERIEGVQFTIQSRMVQRAYRIWNGEEEEDDGGDKGFASTIRGVNAFILIALMGFIRILF